MWFGAVIKTKPLAKPDSERTIFTHKFSLRYVVFRQPKSSYKSSSNMFLFEFPTYKFFNVFWELDSLLFCVQMFIWTISCSTCCWIWEVLCSHEKCCICWLCRFFFLLLWNIKVLSFLLCFLLIFSLCN